MPDTSQVGPIQAGDGATPALRSGRMSDLIVSELHGKYYEQVSRGNVFALYVDWTSTVAAGNINAAAAAASTQFAVWNPITNNKNLSLLRMILGPKSGTAPTSGMYYSQFSGVGVPSVASVGTPYNMLFGNSSLPSAHYMASAGGATLTGGGALVTVMPSAISIGGGATFSDVAGTVMVDELAGGIVLAPGQGFVPTWGSAGTTFIGAYGLVWEEVPV